MNKISKNDNEANTTYYYFSQLTFFENVYNGMIFYNYIVFEIYIWLGNRYPVEFVELVKAKELKQQVSEIIERILEEKSAKEVSMNKNIWLDNRNNNFNPLRRFALLEYKSNTNKTKQTLF